MDDGGLRLYAGSSIFLTYIRMYRYLFPSVVPLIFELVTLRYSGFDKKTLPAQKVYLLYFY